MTIVQLHCNTGHTGHTSHGSLFSSIIPVNSFLVNNFNGLTPFVEMDMIHESFIFFGIPCHISVPVYFIENFP